MGTATGARWLALAASLALSMAWGGSSAKAMDSSRAVDIPQGRQASNQASGMAFRPIRVAMQAPAGTQAGIDGNEPVLPAPRLLAFPAAARPDSSPAFSRSYAIGFALAIVLIALLLAMMALLLRFMLHWTPRQTRPVNPVRERMPPPRPSGTSRRAGGPERRPVVSAGPVTGRPAVRQPAPVPVVPAMMQAEGLPPGSTVWLSEERTDIQRLCVLLLSEAGWEARCHQHARRGCADVVARRNGRVMALRCLAGTSPVEEQSVEEACMAREREKADVAVIVSNAAFTLDARRLAVQTGIDLLHERDLRAFAS